MIKSLEFKSGEDILLHSHTYKSVQNICRSVLSRTGKYVLLFSCVAIFHCFHSILGGKIRFVEIPLDLSKEKLVNLYKTALTENPGVKLVIIGTLF